MKLTRNELVFLAAWAREEWEPACYQLPAHKLQLAHGVSGASLIAIIKAWTDAEGKKDQEIQNESGEQAPDWPWSSMNEFHARLAATNRLCTIRAVRSKKDHLGNDTARDSVLLHHTISSSETTQ